MVRAASIEELEVEARKIKAVLETGDIQRAAKDLQQACRHGDKSVENQATLLSLAKDLPVEWQAQVSLPSEEANPLSPREGKLLKLVPLESRLTVDNISANLTHAIASRLLADSPSFLIDLWTNGKTFRKPAIALMRSYAYLQSKQWDQALADAKTAAVYSARLPGSGGSWPRALAAMSSAIEGKQSNNTQAALYMQRALEGSADSLEYAADLERLMRRIPDQHCEALQAGGSDALQELLKREEEEALPEFKRVRPKYYYYYNWMRERVAHSCGQLPPPIMEKLVRIDATELDMLLKYPKGIQQQAKLLLDVLETDGEDALMAHRIPLLTWRQSEDLKAAYKIEAPPAPPKQPLLESISEAQELIEEDLDSTEPVDFDLED